MRNGGMAKRWRSGLGVLVKCGVGSRPAVGVTCLAGAALRCCLAGLAFFLGEGFGLGFGTGATGATGTSTVCAGGAVTVGTVTGLVTTVEGSGPAGTASSAPAGEGVES